MRPKAFAVIAPFAIVSLSACSTMFGVDGFTDEAAKERVWEVYKCNFYAKRSAESVQMQLTIDAYSGELPRKDEIEAMNWVVKLGDAKSVGDVMPSEDRDGMYDVCTGWLWDHYKASDPNYRAGFEEFTVKDAEDAGLFDQD